MLWSRGGLLVYRGLSLFCSRAYCFVIAAPYNGRSPTSGLVLMATYVAQPYASYLAAGFSTKQVGNTYNE